jgi:hypothetical protein
MPKLTVVTSDHAPEVKTAPMTIRESLDASEKDFLLALRSKVASEIEAGVPAHALAPLMRQLREFDKEIRALVAREKQEAARSETAAATDGVFDASAV